MKQRTIITVLALAAMALSTTPALAQEAINTTTKPAPVRTLMQIKDKMQDKRVDLMEKKADIQGRIASSTERKMEKRNELQTRKASSTERRIDRQQDIAKRQAEHVAKIMTATIERLEKILARIESRIEKVKEDGGNTSESERYVAESKTHLEEAKKSIEAFSSLDLSADKAKENFSRVRSLASEVKVRLKAAHQSMMMAVKNLKS